jgi:hypothetical protein
MNLVEIHRGIVRRAAAPVELRQGMQSRHKVVAVTGSAIDPEACWNLFQATRRRARLSRPSSDA